MLLKEIINKSYYGTTGYIASINDIELLEQYIIYNLPVLKEFKQILVATNYQNYTQELVSLNTKVWKRYFKDCIILDSKINRGHNFGTVDLDEILFNFCKQNNIEWLCKSANDIIFQEYILNKEIKEADFYFTTSVGYAGLFDPYNVSVDKVYNNDEYFYPQTNLYFINTSKCDYLNDIEHVNDVYNKVKNISNYSNKAWEYGFRSCEVLLKECIEKNKLTKYNLIPQEKFIILLDVIRDYQLHDPSHKNIMIEGICHFHYNNKQIIQI